MSTSPAAMLPPTEVPAEPSTGPETLVLVGNPNVGKSVVFGALTGTYVTVSNFPGTTVEISRGSATIAGRPWRVLDTPGTNSLVPLSEDEAVTRDVLLAEARPGATGTDHGHRTARGQGCHGAPGADDHGPHGRAHAAHAAYLPPEPAGAARSAYRVLQVCDAKNLGRGLLIAAQLSEAGVPFALCLNMADEAAERGIRLDTAALAAELGVPAVRTVAVRGEGLDELRRAVPGACAARVRVSYPAEIEDAVARVEPLLPKELPLQPRALALMCLASDASQDPTLWRWLEQRLTAAEFETLRAARSELTAAWPEPARYAIGRARLAWAEAVTARVQRRGDAELRVTLARRFGDLAVHPLWGLPILATVLFAAYELVGVFGAGTAVDFLEEKVFAAYIVPWSEALVRLLAPDGAIENFLVGAPGGSVESGGLLIGQYGLISMALSYGIAIVLPIVATFFVFFSLLEDSGYLPRLAVLVNRLFRAMGLNGKAVLPMVLGLGCDTMATMTTRILETRKERIIVTLLLALGVPCSAQLGVILGMLSGISLWGALWWGGSVAFTVLLVGYLAAKVLPGKGSDFLLELPPIRRPQLSNIVVKTVARLQWYLREAVPLFVAGTFLLWLLDRFGLVAALERAAAPIVQGVLSLPREATGAFIIGFLRRDYGAAGLFALFNPALRAGALPRETEIQLVVSMVTITLFIPCVANFLVIVKERGWKTAIAVAGFIFPFAVAVGGLVNLGMRSL